MDKLFDNFIAGAEYERTIAEKQLGDKSEMIQAMLKTLSDYEDQIIEKNKQLAEKEQYHQANTDAMMVGVEELRKEIASLKEALRKVLDKAGYALYSDFEEEIEQLLK